jgi:hypothetical protein
MDAASFPVLTTRSELSELFLYEILTLNHCFSQKKKNSQPLLVQVRTDYTE